MYQQIWHSDKWTKLKYFKATFIMKNHLRSKQYVKADYIEYIWN